MLEDGEEVLLDDGEEVLPLDEGDELLVPGDGEKPPLLEEGDELAGSLEDCPDDWDDEEPPWMPRAESVCWSSCPDCVRLFCCWNCLSAASVFGPICPSIGPTSSPFDCSACCAWRTSWLPLPCMEVSWAWFDCAWLDCCDALVEDWEVWLSFARTAVLESARAATTKGASFME